MSTRTLPTCARCTRTLFDLDRATLTAVHGYPRPLKTGDVLCRECANDARTAGVAHWTKEN